jgi:Flp pilus assembly protein TadD
VDQAEKPSAIEAMPKKNAAEITKRKTEFENTMSNGVSSYRGGDYNGAELAFRTILASEPRNVAALVGLAKVHQARGNIRLAVSTLLKAADYGPNDPVVVSELVALQGSSGSANISPGRIRELASRTSDNKVRAKLMFILGNKQAQEKRWQMARLSFTEANILNPENPDIAYNLAVVLDYLGDQRRAVTMYRAALRSALIEPSSFDQSAAEERLAALGH